MCQAWSCAERCHRNPPKEEKKEPVQQSARKQTFLLTEKQADLPFRSPAMWRTSDNVRHADPQALLLLLLLLLAVFTYGHMKTETTASLFQETCVLCPCRIANCTLKSIHPGTRIHKWSISVSPQILARFSLTRMNRHTHTHAHTLARTHTNHGLKTNAIRWIEFQTHFLRFMYRTRKHVCKYYSSVVV